MDFIRRFARDWGIVTAVAVVACIIIAIFYIASPRSTALSPGAQIADNRSATAGPSPAPAGSAANPEAAKTNPSAAQPKNSEFSAQPAAQPPQNAAPQAPAPHQNHEPASAGQQTADRKTVAAPVGGDVVAGRQVFRKCQVCHSLEPGKTLIGPSLAGVIGRKAGSLPGYDYSPAMRQANIVWDAKSLDAYVADPQKVVPGNKMPFPGLKTLQDRIDVIGYLAASTGGAAPGPAAQATPSPPNAQAAPQQSAPGNATQTGAGAATYVADAHYTLRSGIAEGRMVFIGVGGAIDGKVNPVLTAAEGQVVQLTLINGEGAEHDIAFPDQDARSPRVTGRGASTTIAFRAGKAGDFTYFCSVPGHRLAGMEGQFIVTPQPPPQTLVEADISREPTDLPPPIGKRDPQTVRVDLLSVEVEGRLAEGTTFGYWTFNGKVPGPFVAFASATASTFT